MKIAFFAFAWGGGGQLDGYLTEVVNGYVGLGFSVDVYLGNYFSADDGVVGFAGDLDVFAAFIRAQGYVGAVAINNALIVAPVVEALEGRVTSVIVDGANHLFRYDEFDQFAAFRLNARFAPIGGQFERDILTFVPSAAERVTLLSPATNGMLAARAEVAPRHAISWVASLPNDPAADALMDRLIDREDAHAVVALCLQSIEQTGDLRAVPEEYESQLARLARQSQLSPRTFEMLLQDVVTARQRIEIVERLAPHGLAVFGNRAWAKAAVLSRGVFHAFQPGPPVRSHDDLLAVYNSSRISVNLPQAFITESFQYRLLDIMASNALLVTKRTPRPDLHRVFGADLPVPMYDTVEELEAICVYFLNHEDERRAIVERCNATVDERFSFQARCLDYLRLFGVTQRPAPEARADAVCRTILPSDIV